MALATAPFGAPGLYSDWGIIGLAQSTNMLETRARDKSMAASDSRFDKSMAPTQSPALSGSTNP